MVDVDNSLEKIKDLNGYYDGRLFLIFARISLILLKCPPRLLHVLASKGTP